MPSSNQPDPEPGPSQSSLTGLDPLGLLDGVIGGHGGDWQPPDPAVLEAAFHGFDQFLFIDRGGMGAVYSARQKSLDRLVAIKILPPELGQDTDFVERFHQEARLLARLQHSNIVTIYDFGSSPAGHLFIVMEYVQGTSLLSLLKTRAVSVVQALEIVCEVCDALQFAHDNGIIHRDIKPTNILLDERRHVKVADFGLAKLDGAMAGGITTSRTQAGRAIGTPGYAAPEQRRAEPQVDARADVFSLGVTLYEMLTGHLPVGVFESPSRKVGSPPALDRVVLRSLQERPALRYQTAAQMKKAIEPIATKLGAPGLRRRLLQRPLTAAVIGIQLLVTGWLLIDKLGRGSPPATKVDASSMLDSITPVPLSGRYFLLEESMSWNRAREVWEGHDGYRLGRIHSETDQKQVAEALLQRKVRFVWLGGYRQDSNPSFQWLDGQPVTYEAWMPAHTEPAVIITEIQARNQETLHTSSGDTPDWLELYNPGSQSVDLKGWRLMERMPYGGAEGWINGAGAVSTVIEPHSYRLILFGLSEPDSHQLSMPFRLEGKGAILRWSDPRGQVVQIFNRPWPAFKTDMSIGCAESGTDWGICAGPTPGAPNSRRVTSIQPPDRGSDASMAILLVAEAGGGWTMEMPQRKAWLLLEKAP